MFDELNECQEKGHFTYTAGGDFNSVCNAPEGKDGIFLIYALKEGSSTLVYMGSSGGRNRDGTPNTRGLKDDLINDMDFGMLRTKYWKAKMKKEKVEALDVYWYIPTPGDEDTSYLIATQIKLKYIRSHGRTVPPWNLRDLGGGLII